LEIDSGRFSAHAQEARAPSDSLRFDNPGDGTMRKIDALGIPLALGGGTTGGMLATQTAIGSGPLAGVTAVTMGIAGALALTMCVIAVRGWHEPEGGAAREKLAQ